MCLGVEFAQSHPVQGEYKYCVKGVRKYFCVKKECIQSPRGTITKFSNFEEPRKADINIESLTEEDKDLFYTQLSELE